MGLHIALHDRVFVSLQGLYDLTKHVEVRYIFLSAVIVVVIVENC